MSFDTFANQKVLVQGLGLNDGGVGMVKFFAEHGAIVKVTDLRTADILKDSLRALEVYTRKYKIEYVLGEHKPEDFKWADIVVRNPAVKRDNEYIQVARDNSAEIVMEMALFHKIAKGLKIGITGTRGKSTTTALIHEFVKAAVADNKIPDYNNVLLAGNIGKTAIAEVESLTDKSISVLEISSFQLDGMGEQKISPDIAVVTNMYPDHLNWHPDMEDYIETKKNIVRFQTKGDYAVINVQNDITKTFVDAVPGYLVTYALDKQYVQTCKSQTEAQYWYDEKQNIIFENGEKLLDLSSIDIKLKGEHNRYNILAAIATARIFKIPVEIFENVLQNFTGLYGRQQLVRSVEGIDFYNDTTATTVEAVESAIRRFSSEYNKDSSHLIFISGGVDKGLDYHKLGQIMQSRVKAVVLFEGTASEKMQAEFKNAGIKTYGLYDQMSTAVQKARDIAVKGDAVILSPAGSSFNMFLNEWDRGKQFDDAVTTL